MSSFFKETIETKSESLMEKTEVEKNFRETNERTIEEIIREAEEIARESWQQMCQNMEA